MLFRESDSELQILKLNYFNIHAALAAKNLTPPQTVVKSVLVASLMENRSGCSLEYLVSFEEFNIFKFAASLDPNGLILYNSLVMTYRQYVPTRTSSECR